VEVGATEIDWDTFSLELHNSLFVQRFLDREGVLVFLEEDDETFKVIVYGGQVMRMHLEILEEPGCMLVRLVETSGQSFALIQFHPPALLEGMHVVREEVGLEDEETLAGKPN